MPSINWSHSSYFHFDRNIHLQNGRIWTTFGAFPSCLQISLFLRLVEKFHTLSGSQFKLWSYCFSFPEEVKQSGHHGKKTMNFLEFLQQSRHISIWVKNWLTRFHKKLVRVRESTQTDAIFLVEKLLWTASFMTVVNTGFFVFRT